MGLLFACAGSCESVRLSSEAPSSLRPTPAVEGLPSRTQWYGGGTG